LPITPGAQRISLTWREPRGMGLFFRTPSLDVGASTVNARTELQVPGNRWVLFVHGPPLGPAVLFWSTLFVLLLVSAALSRFSLTPLRLHQWMLLSLGLSQVPVVAGAVVAGWLLFLGWRAKDTPLSRGLFNLRQLVILGWSVAALGVLAAAIHEGLLGRPD